MENLKFNQYSDSVIKPGIERIKFFLAKLGNPQNAFSSILIGGTNGKSSTACYLYELLAASGIETGVFLSPHLLQFQERVKATRGFSLEELKGLMNDLGKCSRRWGIDLSPFELLTASVLELFKYMGIELAVLEVGMGGRWDATNVTDPLVSLVVSVGMDHTLYLGSSIEAIAWEKFHIARPGKSLIIGAFPLPGLSVFRGMSREWGVTLHELQKDFFFLPEEGGGFCYVGRKVLPHLVAGMRGDYQMINVAMALRAMEVLGMALKGVAPVIGRTRLPGRFQVEECYGVTLVFDVAHNPSALSLLIGEVKKCFPKRPLWAVFQLLRDKPYREMISLLRRGFERLIHLPLDLGGRGLGGDEAMVGGIERIQGRKEWTTVVNSARHENAVVVITGCFGVVREVFTWLRGNGSP